MLLSRADIERIVREMALDEFEFDAGANWRVVCKPLSPPDAHRIDVAYRWYRLSDGVGEAWRVGRVEEMYAKLLELHAQQWDGVVPASDLVEYDVAVQVSSTYTLQVRAATDEMAALTAMQRFDAGALEDGVHFSTVTVVKSGSEGEREQAYTVLAERQNEIEDRIAEQVSAYASGC